MTKTDKSQKHKLRQHLKTKIATKLNMNCDKMQKTKIVAKLQTLIVMQLQTQKIKQQQKIKNLIFIKLKNSNCDNFTQSFGNNNLTPQQPMR